VNLDRIYDGLRKLKFAFLFLLAISFSGFATVYELRFKLQGIPTEAVVVKTYEPHDEEVSVDFRAERGGRTAPAWAKVDVADLPRFQPGTRHEALWLEGEPPKVRIVGYSPSGWLVWVFLLCCGGLIWSVFSAIRNRQRGDSAQAPPIQPEPE
jgi:hypothetical protein